jgi:hypothetical protein
MSTIENLGSIKRAIAVIGPWRGGTSLVTGILAELGVYVGHDFVDAKTGYCTYEDVTLRAKVMQCFDEREGIWKYYGSYEGRVRLLRDWLVASYPHASGANALAIGGKHPVFCKLVPELRDAWSLEGQITFTAISVIRPPEAIHRSWTRTTYPDGSHWWPRGDRVNAVQDLISSRDHFLATLPHISIDFEQLRAKPRNTIAQLAVQLELPTERLDSAVALVRTYSQV